MDDEFKRVSVLLVLSLCGGLVVGAIRGTVMARKDVNTSGWYFRGMLASGMVGMLVGTGIDGVAILLPLKLCIVGGCCLVADDVLTAITTMARLMSADPLGFLGRFRQAWLGVREKPVQEEKMR